MESTNKNTKRKRVLALLKIVLIPAMIFTVAFPAEIAYAADDTNKDVRVELQKTIAKATNNANILQALMMPMLVIAGGLMDTTFILDGGPMEARLLSIWTQFRNFVNIGFVLLLLIIAMYNVLGIKASEKLEIKNILPKFVIALILVNFSFLGTKVIIDASNVLTTAIFALPQSISKDAVDDQMALWKKTICEDSANLTVKNGEKLKKSLGFICDPKSELGQAYASQLNKSNLPLVLAVNMANMLDVPKTPLTAEGKYDLEKTKDFALNQLVAVILFLVMGTAFLAFFIILVARMIMLWVGVALSPVMVIQKLLPDIIPGGEDIDLFKKFVHHAFVPVYIAVPFVIIFVMLSQFQFGGSLALFKGVTAGQLTDVPTNSASEIQLKAFTTLTSNAGISDLQNFLMLAAAIGVFWLAVFSAAKDTLAQDVVGKIDSAGRAVGKFIAYSPKYLPIVPVVTEIDKETGKPKAEAMGLGTLAKIPSGIVTKAEQEYVRKPYDKLAKAMGISTAESSFKNKLDSTPSSDHGKIISEEITAQKGITDPMVPHIVSSLKEMDNDMWKDFKVTSAADFVDKVGKGKPRNADFLNTINTHGTTGFTSKNIKAKGAAAEEEKTKKTKDKKKAAPAETAAAPAPQTATPDQTAAANKPENAAAIAKIVGDLKINPIFNIAAYLQLNDNKTIDVTATTTKLREGIAAGHDIPVQE